MIKIDKNNPKQYLHFPTLAAFPASGSRDRLYLDASTNILYAWNGTIYQALTGLEKIELTGITYINDMPITTDVLVAYNGTVMSILTAED